jgi:hypothetical protein
VGRESSAGATGDGGAGRALKRRPRRKRGGLRPALRRAVRSTLWCVLGEARPLPSRTDSSLRHRWQSPTPPSVPHFRPV